MVPTSIAFTANGHANESCSGPQQCRLSPQDTPLHHRSSELCFVPGESMGLLEARIRQAHKLLRSNQPLVLEEGPHQSHHAAGYTVVRPQPPGPLWTLRRTYSQTLCKSDRTDTTVATSISSQSTVVFEATSCATADPQTNQQRQQPVVIENLLATATTTSSTREDLDEWGYFVDSIDEEEAKVTQYSTAPHYRHFFSAKIRRIGQ